MKKISLLIIIIMFLLNNVIYTQTKYYYVTLGNSRSKFRNEGKTQGNGIAIGVGIGFDANYCSRFNGFMNIEALYLQKRAVAENKIWPASSDRFSDYKVGDINMSIGYLELPLKFGYYTNIGKRGKFRLFSGLSLSVPIVNNTKTVIKEYLYYYPEKKEYEVDYKRDDKDRDSNLIYDFIIDNIGNTSLNLNFGTIISWSLLSFELRYSYALTDTKNFINLTIHDQVNTLYVLLGIKL